MREAGGGDIVDVEGVSAFGLVAHTKREEVQPWSAVCDRGLEDEAPPAVGLGDVDLGAVG